MVQLWWINFISLKQKENFLYEGKKTDKKKDGIESYNRCRRNQRKFIKVKVNGTLNDVSEITNYMIRQILCIDFWINISDLSS